MLEKKRGLEKVILYIYICIKYHNKISFCIKINTDKITTIKHEKNSKLALY